MSAAGGGGFLTNSQGGGYGQASPSANVSRFPLASLA